MQKKVKVCWRESTGTHVGNALGYNTHNKFMKKYASQFLDLDVDADTTFTIMPADMFVPIKGKKNVLFSMWESLEVPNSYKAGLSLADGLIVPSSFCKNLFRKYTDLPIDVCWEGVESESYSFYQRQLPKSGEKFRFLWVGAPNPRKGYPLVLEAIKAFAGNPHVEFYIKTTVQPMNWVQTIKNTWKRRKLIFRTEKGLRSFSRMLRRVPRPGLEGQVIRQGNVIFDTRHVSFDELISLYNSAHCFLLPSFGEGWGLTLSEAMATGAPCVATSNTGTADFFDESVGYVVDHYIKPIQSLNYNFTSDTYIPDTNSFVRRMIDVMNNYGEALKRGKRASDRIHKKFTWEKSGKRLAEILSKYQ
ncbi:MAG: glycosyltransferase [Bacteroidales bacterium]|nr:glycosyltransferase [Bacteroidales bacterium]